MSLPSLKRKIVLGTVQLGLPYGINNSQGKPDEQQAFEILDLATKHNILLLDTADAYGNATEVIGNYLISHPSTRFEIINKFIDDGKSLSEKLQTSLGQLRSTRLYGYMFHRFADYASGNFAKDLQRLKTENTIQKIGVSVYSLRELEQVTEDTNIDLIQVRLSPFDDTTEKKRLIKRAKDAGKEIHVRSVFLQGLLFKTPDQLTGNLKSLYEPLKKFHGIIQERRIDVREACLNYALHKKEIDHVLIGVETAAQLEQNMESIRPHFDTEIIKQLESIEVSDALMLNPSNWKP